ncbi:MAG: cardiolipin synthase [Gammaproteobacteria bacterium]|nr:cardiolipin synthase [Gammaproteobacteria bacterium]
MLEAELAEESFYLIGAIYFLVEMVGVYFAFHAILNTRTSQAGIAWFISLIIIPLLILPLYWIFGSSRFHGYKESFRKASLDDIETAKKAFEEVEQFHVNHINKLADVTNTVKHLEHLPFTSHNSVQLLINGQKTYKAMFEAIEEAQDYVLLQFYIIKNDYVGEAFRQLLTEKMKQGVRVYFLYDRLGSFSLSSRYLQELRDAGAQVSFFNERKGVGKYLHINFRNHRKILIVDGLKAFVGGLNLGQEYLGEDKTMGYWRDTHVMLEGPSVQVTQGVFVKDWYWSVGEVPELNWVVQKAESLCTLNTEQQCNQKVMVLDTGPADQKPVCSLFLCALINQAKKRLWIATPYFVPDPEVINALKNAALRGVDICIILPENYDHYFVYLTSFAYYRELQGYHIKIYRYTKGFTHQKVILLDDELAGVGTVNLDNRSIHLNFEIMAYVADKEFNQQVADMLTYDMNNCYLDSIESFEERPFWFKAISRIFYLMSPIL